MRIVLFVSILLAWNARATRMHMKDYNQGVLKILVTKVEVGSFDTINFTMHNGRVSKLICANNPVYKVKNPIIRYTNFFNIIMRDFRMSSNELCEEFKAYLISIFEGINHKRPLLIHLDKKLHRVSEIFVPDIDPYMLDFDYEFEDKKNRTIYLSIK